MTEKRKSARKWKMTWDDDDDKNVMSLFVIDAYEIE